MSSTKPSRALRDPGELLQIEHYDGHITCVANAASTGRRCLIQVGSTREAAARSILKGLSKNVRDDDYLNEKLDTVAELLTCHHESHQNQQGLIADRWSRVAVKNMAEVAKEEEALDEEVLRASVTVDVDVKVSRRSDGSARTEVDSREVKKEPAFLGTISTAPDAELAEVFARVSISQPQARPAQSPASRITRERV